MAALWLLLCALCMHAPSPGDSKAIHRHKEYLGVSQKSPNSSMKKLSQAQDTLKENHKYWKNQPTSSKSEFSNRPRCGVPDYPSKKQSIDYQNKVQSGKRYRHKRYVVSGSRWDNINLTYKILNSPRQLTMEKLQEVLRNALQVWSDVTPLTFTEVSRGQADITINFTSSHHGDNMPFDGPGGILAHAFFPKTKREGDIHFDLDENWTLGDHMGTDLLQVAAHEFGHVLGLHHSMTSGAIMAAYYSYTSPLNLSEDDKKGIQFIYGTKPTIKPEVTPVTETWHETTETNEVEKTVPNMCQTKFDAVSTIRGELFFFKSGYVWRLRNGKLQPGYPAEAWRHWKGIPDKLDAVFEDKSGNIWFLQGQNYWVFDAARQIAGPDSLRNLGLSVTDIQAALMRPDAEDQMIYVFKGGHYWRGNLMEHYMELSRAHRMEEWEGSPDNIDAAFLDHEGFPIFLRGQLYWQFEDFEGKLREGYPRYIGQDFFNCPSYMYK